MKIFGIGIVSLFVLLLMGYLVGSKYPATGQALLGKVGL